MAAAGESTLGQVFMDRGFSGGLRLSATHSGAVPIEVATVMAEDARATPAWRLAQWGTRHDLAPAEMSTDDTGARTLANAGKRVVLRPGGLDGAGVELALHGGAEFGNRLRAFGEAWPHLLLEQRMDPAVRLAGLEALRFKIALRITTCEATVREGLDPALHTAQVSAFWTVHNQDPDSPDYREMIWFGIPIFDARHATPPGHAALDIGKDDATNKFIFTVDGARVWRGPPRVGHDAALECDLLPHLREALNVSQAHGHLPATRLQDLALTSFNLGWEITGPYNAALHLQHLSLTRAPAR